VSLRPPDSLRSEYGAWTWAVAWEWPDLATTWRLEAPAADRAIAGRVVFLKVVRSGHYPTAPDEAERMIWARRHVPVPELIDRGSDETVDWIITAAIPGMDATRHPLLADPARIVPIVARGLAAFHRAAPVADCPFDFRATTALAHAQARVRAGIATAPDLHPEHTHLGLDGALRELERLTPAAEDLVVCHGDYCMPNVLLDETGTITGYVDLGELGVADRWWDVAVGAWSTTWSIGPGWEELFYESYGIEPDPDRIRFFRLLYDLAS
jgi:kanamycin kinase